VKETPPLTRVFDSPWNCRPFHYKLIKIFSPFLSLVSKTRRLSYRHAGRSCRQVSGNHHNSPPATPPSPPPPVPNFDPDKFRSSLQSLLPFVIGANVEDQRRFVSRGSLRFQEVRSVSRTGKGKEWRSVICPGHFDHANADCQTTRIRLLVLHLV